MAENIVSLLVPFLILCLLWLHQKTFGQVSKANAILIQQNGEFFERNLLLQERLHDASNVKEMLREIMKDDKR